MLIFVFADVLHAKRQLKVHKNSRSRSLGTTAGDMTFMARINTTYASAAPILQVESMPHRKGQSGRSIAKTPSSDRYMV